MFCLHCGHQLGDEEQVCPACGTAVEKINTVEENVEIPKDIESMTNPIEQKQADGYVTKAVKGTGKALRKAHKAYKTVSEENQDTIRKVKSKWYLAVIAVIVIAAGYIAYSAYSQYQQNAKELQAYIEQGLIDEIKTKMETMPAGQVEKIFNRVNQDIQSENNAYVNENTYDADFYSVLKTKISMLYELERLNESTIESMPDLQHCYQETIQTDELYIAEGYLSFLQEYQITFDTSVEEKINNARAVRSNYEEAVREYEAKDYQKAMKICQGITPDELDLAYIENVATLLNEIKTAYAGAIEENIQRAIDNQDYVSIYQFVKAAKEINPEDSKYTEIENLYLEGAMRAVKSCFSTNGYDVAYAICKAIIECIPDNAEVTDLFAETVQGYVKSLISLGSMDTALNILAESRVILPEHTVLTTLQTRLDNDTWRLLYEICLTDLYKENDAIKFTLYPVDALAVPYLLVISGNTYTFYRYKESDNIVETVASESFEACTSTEGLFYMHSSDVKSGYFSNTFIDSWGAYSFDGTKFVHEYVIREINERHYEAFTEKVLSNDYTYMKDDDSISESEYNKQLKKIEEAQGFTAYDYNEQNIENIIYNYAEQ